MISAEQFLAALEEKDLVPKSLVDSLRKQVVQATSPVSAAAVAKRLVDKGLLTPAQAKRILESPPSKGAEPEMGLAPVEEDYGLADEGPKPLAPEPPQGLTGKASAQGPAHGKRSMKDAAGPGRPSKLAGMVPDITPGQARPQTPTQPDKPAKKEDPTAQFADLAPLDDGDDYGISDLPPQPAAPTKPAEAAKPGETAGAATAAKKGAAAAKAEKKPAAKERKPAGSRLLAYGMVVLVAVVAFGAVAGVALTRPTGDEDLQAADAEYQAGRYEQAVEKYDAFLAQFPRHAGAGGARVHRGVARLKLATAGKDWRAASETAKQVLGEMAAQAEFSQASDELAAMLPAIADGMAQQVRRNPSQGLLDSARQGLAMAKRYVPRPLRKPGQFAELDLSLALTARELERPAEMQKAIAEMGQAAAAGKFAEAYARRTAFLKAYPAAAEESALRDALAGSGQAEKSAVVWTDKKQPAQSGEPEGAPIASAVPCQRVMKSAVPGGDGQVVYAMAAGSAFALDAGSGRLLWQRFVGIPASGRSEALLPVAVGQEPGADVIVADLPGQGVARLESKTGKLRWRQTIGQPIEGPIAVAGKRVLVASRAGSVWALDAESGAALGSTQLPQPTPVGPAATADSGLAFVAGHQAHVYVLGADGKCKQVLTLGHEPGSIAVEPVVVGSVLVLATNDGLDDATLRVMTIASDQALPLRAVQTVPLKGHVDARPSVAGTRVAIATDRGAVYLFDAGGGDKVEPLQSLGEFAANGQELVAHYPLLQDNSLWVAGAQLSRATLTGDGHFDARQTMDLGGAFVGAPAAAGEAVVVARRCGTIPGVRVCALSAPDAAPFWETHLGAPVAGRLAATDGTLSGTSAAGAAFRVELSGLKGQIVVEQPDLPAVEELVGPVAGSAVLDDGQVAFAGQGSRSLWIYDPGAKEKPLRRVALPDEVCGGVSVFAGGALVPGRLGQVALLDARTGAKLMDPFQPRLPGGVDYAWRGPGIAGSTLILADGRSKLYAVEESKEPKPHLKAGAEAEAGAIVSPVGVAGQTTAYVADASGTVTAYRLPKLERGPNWPLGSRCVWGPQTVGNRVLVASGAGKLLCLDGAAKLAWQAELPAGPPVGTPLEASGSILLATAPGVVLKIDGNSGKTSGKVELGRPLSAGPASAGTRLFVAGGDGTLYEIKQF